MSISQWKVCMTLTTGLIVFGKTDAQEQRVVQYGIAHIMSQIMPADGKVCSGSMLAAGIIGRKFCVYKPLLPPPDNRDLFLDYRCNILT